MSPRARSGPWSAVLAAVAALAPAGACADRSPGSQVVVGAAAAPVALVALPEGGFRYAERLTGRIREVDGRGRLRPEPVASVAVRTDRQRGLLGLAVGPGDRTYAAWTDPDGVILVGQVAPGPGRVLWRGPVSSEVGNGGHLEFAPDGRLVVGIGDRRRARSGQLLLLDPAGPPEQEPEVLAGGWSNPFGFAYAPSGELWVADNAPGTNPERLVRLAPSGQVTFTLELPPPQIAPSAVIARSDSEVIVCAYLARKLIRFDADTGRRRTLAGGCRTGAAQLADGRIVYATDDDIRVLR